MIHPVQNIKSDDRLACHWHITESADDHVVLEVPHKPIVTVLAVAPLNSLHEDIQLLKRINA